MAQLWQGRFSKAVDSRVNDFNSSIRFDQRMARQDITGSMAHAAMLGACGILSQTDADTLIDGLQGILDENAKTAAYLANKTLRKVQKKVGFAARG